MVKNRILKNRISQGTFILVTLLLSSCGGGTTGTSSTGELRLQGRAEKIQGSPLAGAEMVVFSADSGRELLGSRTDAQGNFTMALPASETGLVLEIEGETTPQLNRHFSDSSVLTTVIVKQSVSNERPTQGNSDNPSRRFFDVRYTFELHINDLTLCTSLSTRNNKIFIDSPIESATCPIEIEAFSNELQGETFYSQLIGICDGDTMPLSLVRGNAEGRMTVDIGEASRKGCTSLYISTYSVQASDTRISFPIEGSSVAP